MMQSVFKELDYRRLRMEMRFLQRAVGPRSAAQRFGFTFDGLFPQTIIYKGRNRDTTWFSMLDKDGDGSVSKVSLGRHACTPGLQQTERARVASAGRVQGSLHGSLSLHE